MSNANTPSFPDFGKLVPGFDFLQNLAKQAAGGASQAMPQLPNLANWIAPTLNVEELDKRVQELKAVQFWLDQNAAALKATIQALEVQKMTLATLKSMNFNMGELTNAFKLKVGETPAASMPRPADKAKGFAGLEIPPSAFQASQERHAADAGTDTEPAAKPSAPKTDTHAAPGMADPMQWWGALTQQFQVIASEAMKEVAKTSTLDPSKSIAVGMAKDAVKTAAGLAKNMAETATKTMTGGTRAAMKNTLGGNWPTPIGAKASTTAAPRKAAAKPSAKAAAKTGARTGVRAGATSKTPAPVRKAAGAAARKKSTR